MPAGYANSQANVTVTTSVITVGNVTVAPGGTAQFPVTLSSPAPAGGLTVNLATLNAAIATVPASVFIPQGQSVANPNPLVTGIGVGATTIRGTAPNYAPGAGTATVAIAGSFSPSPVSVIEGQVAQATLTLAQPAPTALTVNLSTSAPTTATVPATVTIPASASSVQVPVTGVQAGITVLTASGTGLVTTTVTINVSPPPANEPNCRASCRGAAQRALFAIASGQIRIHHGHYRPVRARRRRWTIFFRFS